MVETTVVGYSAPVVGVRTSSTERLDFDVHLSNTVHIGSRSILMPPASNEVKSLPVKVSGDNSPLDVGEYALRES